MNSKNYTKKDLDKKFELSYKRVLKHLKRVSFDITDLSPFNIKVADNILEAVYKDWSKGNIDDFTAASYGNIFESEPIHHLMSVSVYPLADINHYIYKKNYKKISKLKVNL